MKKAVMIIETKNEKHMEALQKLLRDYQEEHMADEEEAILIFEDSEAQDKEQFNKWTDDLITQMDYLNGNYMSN